MKKRIAIVVGLAALGVANIRMTRAQPPEPFPRPLAPAEVQLKVQRAEANAQIMAFATETMRSQLPPEEFARWPSALRDASPYSLESQPFEAWSPQLQGFAMGKFRALAADAKVETFAPAAKNKEAVSRWLQEKAPFENAQLEFFLAVRLGLNVKDEGGATPLRTGRYLYLTTPDMRLIVALGRLMDSLSPEQKSGLFANKMHLPIAQLSQEQKQFLDESFNNGQAVGGVPVLQFPNSEIAIDFRFMAIMQRVIGGKKDYLEVELARPFDYLAR